MRYKVSYIVLSCIVLSLLVFQPSLGSPGEPPVISDTDKSQSEVVTEKSEATETVNNDTTTVGAAEDSKNTTEETIESIVLPEVGSAAKEHSSSMAIFFLLFILILSIFLLHALLKIKFHYLPESLAMVFLGAMVGLFMMALPEAETKRMESFSPTMFFLILLPPIIFESGYNLHKGNFFQNIGSIMVFAILGTAISALIVGGGKKYFISKGLKLSNCFRRLLTGPGRCCLQIKFYSKFCIRVSDLCCGPCSHTGNLSRLEDNAYHLESKYCCLSVLDVDPVLNMLVFGESILNDAVAIVLTTTVIESESKAEIGVMSQVAGGVSRFFGVFFGSAAIGTLVALISSLVLKHIDLYTNPSLEFALMLCFIYTPYALAEGVHLSGIMAILFCGLVMSHYTHYNLSPVTQITMQQTMRTLAFVCETSIFIYLGLGIFSFPHRVELSLSKSIMFPTQS